VIDVYPTRTEARDEDGVVLFTLQLEQDGGYTMSIKNPAFLTEPNLEKVLTAVIRAENILGIKDFNDTSKKL
jgi:hypothetical protein